MHLTGRSIIGFKRGQTDSADLHGFNPATGETLIPAYHFATKAEVNEAAELASKAFASYSQTTGVQRATFLRKIASNIEALGDVLISRATQETGLAEGRIRTETGRTCNQLRLFADLVEEGSWVDARIDHADPNRAPIPKPDVAINVETVGPSRCFWRKQLSAGVLSCRWRHGISSGRRKSVIVKAHQAHPGTSELVGMAVSDAARACELHEECSRSSMDPAVKLARR
jgi:NADP-dependent aldehyde dehydrogenase